MSTQFPSPTQDCICRAFTRDPACRAHHGALVGEKFPPTVGPEPVKERDVRELLNELGLAVARIEQYMPTGNGVTEAMHLLIDQQIKDVDRISERLAALDTRLGAIAEGIGNDAGANWLQVRILLELTNKRLTYLESMARSTKKGRKR